MSCRSVLLQGRRGAGRSGLDREVSIERLADFYHFLAGETAGGSKLGDRFEVMVLPTRQAPVQHASRDAADVLEAVHNVARDEDDAAGTRLGVLIADGHLISNASFESPVPEGADGRFRTSVSAAKNP